MYACLFDKRLYYTNKISKTNFDSEAKSTTTDLELRKLYVGDACVELFNIGTILWTMQESPPTVRDGSLVDHLSSRDSGIDAIQL